MSTPTKPSPSQFAALEQAFASAPSSDAWRPLAEAYLATGRHLEATVVSKKAARQRPADPAPRVLLARVLAAQGKPQKASEAVQEALRLGPADADALAFARELGVNAAAVPAAGPAAAAAPHGAAAPAERLAGEAIAGATPADGFRKRRRGGPPGLDPSWSQVLARRFGAEADAEPSARRRSRARRRLARTVALTVTFAVVLGVAAMLAGSRRARATEVERLLSEARPLLQKDTWAAARDASDRCERALALDAASADARACAAWTSAVRWIDHGEGEGARDAAKRHVAALGSSPAPAHAAAAAAMLRAAEGDARGAAEALRARAAAEPGSAVIQAAYGEALLAAGDLDGASAALGAAQRLAPGDVRTLRLLADQFRRRGGADATQAEILYEIALGKLAPEHPGALLGKARLLLDRRAHAETLSIAERVAATAATSPRQRAIAQALRSRAQLLAGRKEDARGAEEAARALDPAGREVREILSAQVSQAGQQLVPAAAQR